MTTRRLDDAVRSCLVVAFLLLLATTTTRAFLLSTTTTTSHAPASLGMSAASSSEGSNHHPNKETATSSDTASSSSSSSLSSLVNDMLQSQKEMQNDKNAQRSAAASSRSGMPELGPDGMYHIASEQEYKNFLAAHADKLVVVKFSSRTCQACQVLQQKFQQYIHREAVLQQAPVVFADVTVVPQRSASQPAAPFTQFVTQTLQVTRIPDVHFYTAASANNRRQKRRKVDTYNCDPTLGCSWGELKDKMIHFCQTYGTTERQERRRWVPRLLGRWFSSSE